MPLVAAAVCPHPPLLVPEIAAGAAGELDDLRAGCHAALARLREARPDTILVVGSGTDTGRINPPFQASFAPWGVPLRIGDEGPRLPLSLAVGVWLLNGATLIAHPLAPSLALCTVASTATPRECAVLGADLGAPAERVALLVMGDGSAHRGPAAPGLEDPRAQPYDETVARALRTADTAALLALDPALSAQLQVAGRAAWQVLGGAVQAAGGDWRGELLYDAAPYGVAYFVASWRPV